MQSYPRWRECPEEARSSRRRGSVSLARREPPRRSRRATRSLHGVDGKSGREGQTSWRDARRGIGSAEGRDGRVDVTSRLRESRGDSRETHRIGHHRRGDVHPAHRFAQTLSQGRSRLRAILRVLVEPTDVRSGAKRLSTKESSCGVRLSRSPPSTGDAGRRECEAPTPDSRLWACFRSGRSARGVHELIVFFDSVFARGSRTGKCV